jgi:hypothetical protein
VLDTEADAVFVEISEINEKNPAWARVGYKIRPKIRLIEGMYAKRGFVVKSPA